MWSDFENETLIHNHKLTKIYKKRYQRASDFHNSLYNLLGIINVALPVLNIPGEFQKAIYGLIIVVALALDQLIIYRMKKLSVSANV